MITRAKILTTLVIAFLVILVSGCSTTATMYPVEGPFFEQRMVQGIPATVNGIEGNSGTLTVTLPDGEEFSGQWSVLAPQSTTTSWGSLFTDYGAIYGNSVSSSNLAGVNKGTAYLVGSKGTTMDVEFLVGSGTASGNGIGKDSNGNIYKLIF